MIISAKRRRGSKGKRCSKPDKKSAQAGAMLLVPLPLPEHTPPLRAFHAKQRGGKEYAARWQIKCDQDHRAQNFTFFQSVAQKSHSTANVQKNTIKSYRYKITI